MRNAVLSLFLCSATTVLGQQATPAPFAVHEYGPTAIAGTPFAKGSSKFLPAPEIERSTSMSSFVSPKGETARGSDNVWTRPNGFIRSDATAARNRDKLQVHSKLPAHPKQFKTEAQPPDTLIALNEFTDRSGIPMKEPNQSLEAIPTQWPRFSLEAIPTQWPENHLLPAQSASHSDTNRVPQVSLLRPGISEYPHSAYARTNGKEISQIAKPCEELPSNPAQ